MQLFQITDNYLSVVCETKNTKHGFKHTATLFRNGHASTEKATVSYLNRTWESWTFQTVLEKLAGKLMEAEKAALLAFIEGHDKESRRESDRAFAAVAMVAKMGELIGGDTQAEKNDWKLRMIKAGLENKGLSVPDNWDGLTEDEKTRRLDAVIAELGNKEVA